MGRGSSKVSSGKHRENDQQFKEAVFFGKTRGAGSVEFTDSFGNIKKFKIKDRGGTYRASYNPKVEKYSKMSLKRLESELKKQQAISDKNYMMFARSAASKSASQVNAFANADIELHAIRQALRRKKKRG